MLYYIVFFILFLALVAAMSKDKAVNNGLFIIAVASLIIFCGIRDPFIYPDNINYYYFFNGHFDYAEEGTLGWGYSTFTKLISFFTKSFPVYCFIVSWLIVGSYSKAIKKYSPYKWLSLLLFILVNYYPTFFLLRQYLVMPLFFLCVKFTLERKLIPYLICVALAFSVHTTSIIILPLYFLYGLKYSKFNMFLITVGSLAAMFAFMIIGPLLSFVGSYYLHYFEMTQEEPAWQRAVMKIAIMAVFIFALGKKAYEEGINRILFYSFLFNVIICIGAINIFGVFRLRDYYSIADIVGIPVILSSVKKSGSFKKMIVYISTVVYIVLLILSFISFVEGANMNNDYQFFWEGHPIDRD